ncbi:S-adenosyl-L-methionine-dependent methyltransferase [Pestalotiopsis sp. NC0098]|nr:S-adenosyl-L-methionine-dependent methyltransferase [Pestalotiopsis sp. NC0098]
MAEIKDVVAGYPLPKDLADWNRLNLQHYLYKEVFGYLLHPKIQHSQKSLSIADVGTGTGIWLFDLSSQFDASTELVGLDADISQVGAQEWLPQNMSLRQWDAFTDPPKDLQARFDIVNLRLFCYVIQDDPTVVLRNVIKLLKPGGYLQWCDVDVSSMHINTSRPDVSTESLQRMWDETIPKGSLLRPSWPRDLPQCFEKEGLLDVEADWQQGKRHTGIAMHWCNLPVHEMMVDKLRAANPEKASELHDLIQDVFTVSRKGAVYSFDRVVVIGRKALV